MKYFSEDTKHINAECESCGRVLKIPLKRCSTTINGFSVAPAVMCQCGTSSNHINISGNSRRTSTGTQGQCPNCGGYKTETSKVVQISTREPVSSDERKKQITELLKFLRIGVIINIVVFAIVVTSGIGKDTDVLWACVLPFVALVFFASIPSIVSILFQKTKKVRIGQIYNYYCHLCGYKWSWKTGTSLPKVNINPDLIAKGAKKIEDEEEERRKQAIAYDILNRKD